MVLDASITAARVHLAERTQAVEDVFAAVALSEAWVTGLWHLEVANIFQMKVRRKAYGLSERDKYLAFFRTLPIFTDPETASHAWTDTLILSQKHDLTIYDASYLELALRRGLPLATLDIQLRAAATHEGVSLLGL
jgi:predicted nucleic acid-binding protein